MQEFDTLNSAPHVTSAAIDESLKALVTLLKTGDEAQRCYSARALVSSYSADVENALNENLYHQDPDVVIDSATTLSSLRAGDISMLIEVATLHPESDAQLAAMDALSHHMDNEKVIALMCKFAKGRPEGEIWEGNSDWDDWWDIQLKAITILSAHAKSDYFTVFQDVLDSDPEPELELKIYQGIAKQNVNWIVEQLPTATSSAKRKLLKSLSYSDEQIAKAFLFKHLNDDDPITRKIAVECISEKGAKEYFWDIVNCLQDNSYDVQKAAITALSRFDDAVEINQDKLIGYINKAEPASRPLLFELLQKAGSLDTEQIGLVLAILLDTPPQALLNITQTLLESSLQPEQVESLLELYIKAIESHNVPTSLLVQLIRSLADVKGFEAAATQSLQNFVNKLDEQTLEHQFDMSVRQAAFDALSRSENSSCEQLIKTSLFGINAYPDIIEVDVVEPSQEAIDEETAQALHLEQMLDEHESNLDAPVGIVNTPSSTLGAIQQATIETELAQSEPEPDQQQHIVDMVDELDADLDDYAQIVKANFDSADNLNLNRKKIAKLPTLSNKVLAIKALGQSENANAAEWLIESILGAEANELREIFQSLKRLKVMNPKNKIVDNGIGAAGNIVYHGDDLTKQAAISFLAVMPASKAVPLLVQALTDQNDHVRLCSLNALEHHMQKIKLNQKALVSVAVKKCLQDSAGGVRQQALKLAALYKTTIDADLQSLVDLALDDEECHKVADLAFGDNRMEVLTLISSKLPELKDHHQPNAIKLIGQLIAG